MTAMERALDGHMAWRSAVVDGRPARYGVGGAETNRPLLFLHGWAVSNRTYRRALDELVTGFRVYAPALPGFGGAADLPLGERSLPGYARWVAAFAREVGITEPVTVVGHSFGGGVAIRFAHDTPDLAERLVLVNSVGGSAWTHGLLRALPRRPPWDWGLHLPADLWPARQLTQVIPVILRDAIPNFLRNPGAMWRVATLARTANLGAELAELKRRRLPIAIVWSNHDNVIPSAAFVSLRASLGDPDVITVPGGHSWLLGDPHLFGEVITNIIPLGEQPHELAEPA